MCKVYSSTTLTQQIVPLTVPLFCDPPTQVVFLFFAPHSQICVIYVKYYCSLPGCTTSTDQRCVCFKALRNPMWEESCCTLTCRTLEHSLSLSLSLFFSYSALSLSVSQPRSVQGHTHFNFTLSLHFFIFFSSSWGHLWARGFVWEKKG